MQEIARKLFNSMCADMAKTYGVDTVARTFAAEPTIEQKLMDKLTESIAFLQAINIIPVRDLKGEKVLGSVNGIIGKRTDTNNNDRQPQDPLALDDSGYECFKTEYDVLLKYATIDAWSKFPDLHERFLKYTRKAIGLSRIKIGFYGESAAAETDSDTNPNGEDANIGWLQKLREYKSGAQFLSEVVGASGQIRVGEGGDYLNLDSFVHDLLQLVNPIHRERSDLVAIMGRDLLSYDKNQLFVSQGNTPTEKERIENAAVTRTYGSLPAKTFDNFPSRGLLITPLDNLSIYYQEGSVRQKIDDNAKRDRIEYYNSINDAYVIEDEEATAGVEFKNVLLWDGNNFV